MSVNLADFDSYKKFKGISTAQKNKRKVINTNNPALMGLKVLSPAKKVIDCYEEYKDGNCIYAIGMGLRFFNDFFRDKKRIKNALIPDANYNSNWQEPFCLIKGSLIQNTKIGKKLKDSDINLFRLISVQKLLKKIGMINYEQNSKGYIKIEGSVAAKLLGGTALRIPLLGIGLYLIIGTDGIILAKNNKDRAKELGKDVINAVVVWTAAGFLGCIGRHYGKLTDLLFMGAGFVAGRMLAKKINSFVFQNGQLKIGTYA